ncbi:hypothetical protein [Spirosoma agri]|uniref:DUF2938 domain-containing protein n=1 Tax=Spirosoma agri TaxID=1987381 RepID=A0A6M0ILH3_9BACT|nr:hypothetical protein [Spirosoma agri]NEU68737.1 hypothetical protein [Spirosoma agri]
MNGLNLILASVAGTSLMTAFMYIMTFLTDRIMNVVKILGTMLTFQTSPDGKLSDRPRAISVGIIAHYAIGIVFTLCYSLLWSRGVGQPDFQSGIWFGIGSGLVAIAFWYGLFAIHPNPPAIPLKPYLLTLFVAHIVFTFGVIIAYNQLK